MDKATGGRDEARQLLKYTRGRFAITWKQNTLNTSLPHLDQVKQVADLLWLDACIRLETNDVDGAWRSAQAILHAAKTLGDEPSMVGQIIRSSCVRLAINMMNRVLAQAGTSRESLEIALQLLAEEYYHPRLRIGYRGDRAILHQFFVGMESGQLKYSSDVVSMHVDLDAINDLRIAEEMKPAHVWFLQYMGEAIEASELPYEQQRAALEQLDARMAKAPRFARLFTPRILRAAKDDWNIKGSLLAAMTALAAECYRTDHGNWPRDIADLTPKHLTKPPIDFFDNMPIRMNHGRDGLVVYSIGLDHQDDRGFMDPLQLDKKGTDLAFYLRDTDKRRWLKKQ